MQDRGVRGSANRGLGGLGAGGHCTGVGWGGEHLCLLREGQVACRHLGNRKGTVKRGEQAIPPAESCCGYFRL